MISKAEVAIVLGLATTEISDSVYNWGKSQFYILTGLKAAETTKTERKFFNQSTLYFKLNGKDIKTIDTLKIDNETTAFTLFTDLKFNPDSGLVYYSGGFSGGQLVEITYTMNDYTHADIHDYLITLLVTKAMYLFSPDKFTSVKSIKIGNYQKQFFSTNTSLEDFTVGLEREIQLAIARINDTDDKLTVDMVV